MTHPSHPQRGILLAVAAVAFFAAYDTGAKVLSGAATVVMLLWTRYFLQVLWMAANVKRMRRDKALATQRTGFHIVRALSLLVCNVLAFYSFKYLPVANVTAIAMLTPLLLTVIAAWLFKEQVTPLQWVLVGLALTGALMVAKPANLMADIKLLLPLGFVLSYTAFQAITSRLVMTESPDTVMFYTSAVGFGVLSCLAPFAWVSLPNWHWYVLLVLVGSFSSTGHHILVLAYRWAPASVITPYLYLQLVFAAVGGVLVFGERPDTWSVIGGILIAGSGVSSTWVRQLSRAKAERRAAHGLGRKTSIS